MNKSEFIEQLAQKSNIGQSNAEEVVNLIIDELRSSLASGKRVEIRGFGSFVVKNYGSYWGRNPRTNEKIFVQEKKLPAFKVGKELRERLNASEKNPMMRGVKKGGNSGSEQTGHENG